MAATSMKLDGKRSVIAERAILSDPSSSGWRALFTAAAGDTERSILQRLAEHFQDVAWEFGELVEEKHAVVRQAGFAGARHAGATADQAGVGDGMVRRAERALVQESGARSQGSGDAVDFGGFDGLFEG